MNPIVAIIFLSIASAKPHSNAGFYQRSRNNNFPIDGSLVEFDGDPPDVPLITFDGDPTTTFEFRQTNDPVMGGVSSGSWSINEEEGYGVESGTVRDVPSLHAPGFIKATAHGRFNDASSVISGDLILHVRSNISDYSGYRVSFGNTWNAFKDFKAGFSINAGEDFSEARIPFNKFSSEWDPATGDQTVTCAEDPRVCPTFDDLARIRRIELWAEGVKGDARIEVKSISAGIKKQPRTKPPSIKKFSSMQENDLGIRFALDLYEKTK